MRGPTVTSTDRVHGPRHAFRWKTPFMEVPPDKHWQDKADEELSFADLRGMSQHADPAVSERAQRLLKQHQEDLRDMLSEFNRGFLGSLKVSLFDGAKLADTLRISHQRADEAEARVAEISGRPTPVGGDVTDSTTRVPELLEALNDLTAANRSQLDVMTTVLQGVLAQTLAVNGQMEALNAQVISDSCEDTSRWTWQRKATVIGLIAAVVAALAALGAIWAALAAADRAKPPVVNLPAPVVNVPPPQVIVVPSTVLPEQSEQQPALPNG